MNLFVQQNFVIHTIRIDGISNSSVFQIGSAGVIKSLSQYLNTGGFTQPAPAAGPLPTQLQPTGLQPPTFYVPLLQPGISISAEAAQTQREAP